MRGLGKKSVIASFLAAPGLLLTGHGNAIASPETDFVAALREQGAIQDSVSDQVAIDLGNMICQKLSEGVSQETMIHTLEDEVPGQPMAANELVSNAAQYLCPQYQ